MTRDTLLLVVGLSALALVGLSARRYRAAATPVGRLAATTVGWGLLVASLGLLDLAIPNLVNSYALQIIIKVGIYVTLAVSLNIINGITGQFSMGHAGFMAVGAYVSAYLTMTLGASTAGWVRALPWNGPWTGFAGSSLLAGLPWGLGSAIVFVIALVAGGTAAAIAGYLVGIPSLRLRGDYLAIVTLGFGEIIRNLIANIDVIGASRGLSGVPHASNIFWVFLFGALSIFVSYRLLASSPGRAMLAVREDEVAAAAMGIDTTRTKIQAFAIGTFFAGVAGGLLGHHFEYLHPDYFKFDKSFEVIIMVVLGGMGSVSGSAIAATLLALAPEVLRYAKDLLGSLTEPAVLYGIAPFVLFALVVLVLLAGDVVRLVVKGALSAVSSYRLRSGKEVTSAELARLRTSGGRRLVGFPAQVVSGAPIFLRDAGLGAAILLVVAAAHRAFLGSGIPPRTEYWLAVVLGLAGGAVVGRVNVTRRAARASRTSAPVSRNTAPASGTSAPEALPAAPDSRTPAATAVPVEPARQPATVRFARLASVGLLAPAALAASWALETQAPELLLRISRFFVSIGDPRMVLYSIMLIAMMLTRPTGLFGSREISAWWRDRRAGSRA